MINNEEVQHDDRDRNQYDYVEGAAGDGRCSRRTGGGGGRRDGPCWTAYARIGEASNPGPATAPQTAYRHPLGAKKGEVIKYPPGDGCLLNVLAPGHAATRGPQGGDETFRLVMETVTPTGWTALKRRLTTTNAHVLMAQETWVTQSAMAAASSWARRNGWKSIWSPAITTDKGGTSAGVALFAREFMGLHFPEIGSHELVPARAVIGVLEAPGGRPMKIVSCYLKHGCGASVGNATTLAAIGAAIERCGDDEVCVIGADYNMAPSELLGTNFDRRIGATIFHPNTDRGTYRTAKARSTIDYFMVSDRLSAAVDDVDTVEGTGVRGHVPVQLTFKAKLASLRALHVRQPPRLGMERVHGPLPPPPDWSAPAAVATAALAAARADAADADDILEAAYGIWADMAEDEIGTYTGEQPKKKGERAKRPKLVWRTVLPEKKVQPRFSHLAATVWLRGVVSEAQRVAAVASRASGRATDRGTSDASSPAFDDEHYADDDADLTAPPYIHADDDAPEDPEGDADEAHADEHHGRRNQRERKGEYRLSHGGSVKES